MEVPEYIATGLNNVREGLHLRWNPRAVLLRPGSFDAMGKATDTEWDPRWELWDTDPDGAEYMVMRVQNADGSFRSVDERLIRHLDYINPARYGGDLNKLIQAQIDDPEALREMGTEKDSDDVMEDVARRAAWIATPKSAAGLSYRGKRILSG